MRRRNLCQLAEDLKLELGDLGHSLDDEVDRREVLNVGAGFKQRAGLIGLLLSDS